MGKRVGLTAGNWCTERSLTIHAPPLLHGAVRKGGAEIEGVQQAAYVDPTALEQFVSRKGTCFVDRLLAH